MFVLIERNSQCLQLSDDCPVERMRLRVSAISIASTLFLFTAGPFFIAWGYSSGAVWIEASPGASSAEVVSIASSPMEGFESGESFEPAAPSVALIPVEEMSPVSDSPVEVVPHTNSGISRPISSEVSESRFIELAEIGELEVAELAPAVSELLAKVGEGSLEASDSLDRQKEEPKSAQEIAAAESQDGDSPKIPKASVASVAFSSAKSTGVESDTLPNASSQAIPEYPPDLLSKGVEGVVVLKIEVSSSGDVVNCSLHTTSGYPEMDQSALKAVKTWKFVPAKLLGQSVACTVLKKVRFKIVPQEPVPSNSSAVPAQ